ncbi:MAG: hypothetical protein QOH46_1989, partial [Solirubrobacteraceae bacterium]|nr:hypothetical protein [Solirubrobacteraceae bacterium]
GLPVRGSLRDLEALGGLARLSTYLTDARAEICAVARQVVRADSVAQFELIGRALKLLQVTGRPLPGGRAAEFPHAGTILAAPVLRGLDRHGVPVWLWRTPRRPLSRYESTLVDLLLAGKGLAVERRQFVGSALTVLPAPGAGASLSLRADRPTQSDLPVTTP